MLTSPWAQLTFDPLRHCPKCGGTAQARHLGYSMIPYDAIQRKCERCGYVWHEKPLDVNDAA